MIKYSTVHKIPLFLITGFLGSGKTTLIKNILESKDNGYRIGIVQNEFAPANVDGIELKNTGKSYEILEINNGSIFCVCLLKDFITSLASFIDQKKPDLIIIETSGLSDPIAIAEILQHSELNDKVYLKASWCIVDSGNFLNIDKMLNRVQHQLLVADQIIINKIDSTNTKNLNKIRKRIIKINPLARIFEAEYCQIEVDLEKLQSDPYPIAPDLTNTLKITHESRAEMIACVFKSGRKIPLKNLENLIQKYLASTIRIKGFVHLNNNQTALVQTVFKNMDIHVVDQIPGNTSLVLMGENFNLSAFSRDFRVSVE